MNRQLLQRRTDMLNYVCKGVPLQSIVEDLSTKYEVTDKAIYQDWGRRKRWMPTIARLDDPSILNELIQGIQQIIPNAWYEYKVATNPSIKIGALRLAKETYFDLITVLQSLGRIEKIPEEIRAELKVMLSPKLMSEPLCNDSQPSPTNPMPNKKDSTKDDTIIVTEQHSQESEAEKPSAA